MFAYNPLPYMLLEPRLKHVCNQFHVRQQLKVVILFNKTGGTFVRFYKFSGEVIVAILT